MNANFIIPILLPNYLSEARFILSLVEEHGENFDDTKHKEKIYEKPHILIVPEK